MECHELKKVTFSFFSYGDFHGNLIVTVYFFKTYIKILIVFFWKSKMGPNFGQNTRKFLLFFVKWKKNFFFDVFDGILGWQRFETWNTLFTITKFMFYKIIFHFTFSASSTWIFMVYYDYKNLQYNNVVSIQHFTIHMFTAIT